jgi:hypothetical protein
MPLTASRNYLLLLTSLALTALTLGSNTSAQTDDYPGNRRFCTGTATAMFEACRSEGEPDHWKAVAVCSNMEDDEERGECFDEIAEERREEGRLCRAQLAARRSLCDVLGEDRYEPDFDPRLFDSDFTRLSRPNRYYPLTVGARWDFAAPDETITVEVLNKTKLVEGVTCIVVNDKVSVGGRIVEDTDDWIAQARNGDVYYCGEEVKDFETFSGDAPEEPELVSIDGSFKTGRDGDKPGILFRGAPLRGELYRQEFSLGNAEDVAEVLTTTYAFGRDSELDRFVPRALADLLCPGDCVVTREYTPLEPGAVELKYYAARIGKFLEVNPETGNVVRLVACNVDSRCNAVSRASAR